MDEVTQISQLVVRERQSRVRRLTDQMTQCFHPDATVSISWYRGSAIEFVSAAGGGSADRNGPIVNRLGPPVVQRSGRRAVVELPSTTIHWISVNGLEAELVTFMRLLYRVEERDRVWRISDLTAVYESDALQAAVPGTNLHIDTDAMVGLRHSYRWLAYTRSLEGQTLSQDLVGIDRVEDVDALYEQAFTWLSAPSDEAGGS